MILPTYNRAHFLSRAIESVRAQTFSDWELLVMDNGSTDGTVDLIRQFQEKDTRVRFLKETQKGASYARNLGLKEAVGKLFAFLDDDDEWLPEKLSRQVAFFKSHPATSLLYTHAYMKDGGGILMGLKPSGKPAMRFEDLLEENTIPLLTVMVKRECIEKVGGFDPTIPIGEDYDLWLRISKEFPIGFLQESLAVYYRHGQNMSTQRMERYKNTITVFGKLLCTCHDPFQLERIGRRFVFLHYQLAKEAVVRNDLAGARFYLGNVRELLRFHHFPEDKALFMKSCAISMLLLGGVTARYLLSRWWMRRESADYANARDLRKS
ncbi:MAG: glycosyltransferase [Candidatus Omnitrophota bacterium]